MGRLQGTRARVLLTVVLAVAIPAAALAASRMTITSGAAGLSLVTGLVVVHLLSVGPRGAVLAWAAYAVHGLLVVGNDPSLGLAVLAAVQAAAAVACVRVLEARFAHHGPVRKPIVMVDFGLLAAVGLPLLVAAVGAWLAPALGIEPWPGPLLQQALAEGIGVLAVTAGVRMLVMGERIDLDVAAVVGLIAAAVLTAASVLVTLEVGGIEALASAQVVLMPLLLVALLVGTAAYTLSIALATIAIVVPVAIAGTGGHWAITTPTHALWWLVAFVGLLLATDGDRRRAAAVEFRNFFTRSATPSLSVNAGTGVVTRANEAVAVLLGSRVEDLTGRRLTELVDHEPEIAAKLRQLLAGEVDECAAEFALRPGPEQERWVRCLAARVVLGGPQPDVLQVQFVDLTAERERASALERSNEALSRFGRRVTHDLKQPLAAVAAYASTLAEHGDRLDPTVTRTMFDRLESVAKRAVDQLDETFSSAVGGGDTPRSVNLHEVVASVVGVADIDLTEAEATVDTALAASRVTADPSMLRQILLNLCTNSLKYAADGTALRIRVASRVRGAGVEITVTDNGTGIPADDLERVFDRGHRLDPNRADGRGHGLADSRELAEAAGGWLRAEPWPDGARFVLWLPDPTVVGAESPTRVVLVDDEPDQLDLLQRRLQLQASIEVVGSATSIRAAVAATRDLQPDVVLLDRWLNNQDGLQGVVELARAHPDVRIILFTADVSPGLPERARSGGVVRTLDKTMPDEDLVAQLVGRGVQ